MTNGKFTDKKAKSLKKVKRHQVDGRGMYFVVTEAGSRKWTLRFRSPETGKVRELGLGVYPDVSLKAARGKADAARKLLTEGRDPITFKAEAGGDVPTFEQALDEFVRSHGRLWRNEKHRAQWRNAIALHAAKLLPIRVNKIEVKHVIEPLDKIWTSMPETASRIRGRIERVLDAERARGHRAGENPARWKGNLETLLPRRRKLKRGHHKALAWEGMPAFMVRLRKLDSVSSLALEWTILTAARTGEVIAVPKEGEIDLETRVWTVPPERMKSGREHRVPLVERCIKIYAKLKALPGPWLFPSTDTEKHISNMAMAECLKGLIGNSATVHGMRSTFKDWAADATEHPNEISEAALAHIVGDATERAYRRGDALDRRRELMRDWAIFCGSAASKGRRTK